MFHSSSSSSSPPYSDPAFCCAAGPPPLTGSLNPYASAFYDATIATHALSSSLPSHNYSMHRSGSTHSFTHHQVDPTPSALFSSSPSSACDLLDFHSDPVRRVFSTGDLQGIDNGVQDGAAAAARVGRYTAEERMKRIERYRSKRNQRNFHKKITYACRKTLADSRPRVRGRFARNGETEGEPEAEAETSEITYERFNNHHNNESCASYDNYNSYENKGDNAGEWWRQMQAALATTDEDCSYDEDIWASFDSVFSINLLS